LVIRVYKGVKVHSVATDNKVFKEILVIRVYKVVKVYKVLDLFGRAFGVTKLNMPLMIQYIIMVNLG
jgi:hypothetical protein